MYREIRIWQSLEHPHVLPLLGICYNANTYESIRASGERIVDPMVSIGIVCPWMENGTLVDYLKHRQTQQENMEELRLRLVRPLSCFSLASPLIEYEAHSSMFWFDIP